MKRTIDDIRANIDFVGCDNATALELCDEVERLRMGIALAIAIARGTDLCRAAVDELRTLEQAL